MGWPFTMTSRSKVSSTPPGGSMEVSEGSIARDPGSAGSEPGASTEPVDVEDAGPKEEDAGPEAATANGCTTRPARTNTAARRSHRATIRSPSGRGGNADLLVDGTSDSMGSQFQGFSRLRCVPLRINFPAPSDAGEEIGRHPWNSIQFPAVA